MYITNINIFDTPPTPSINNSYKLFYKLTNDIEYESTRGQWLESSCGLTRSCFRSALPHSFCKSPSTNRYTINRSPRDHQRLKHMKKRQLHNRQ